MNTSDMKTPDDQYWRRKLNAFMHDNPDKAYDVKQHELKAWLNKHSDQFIDGEYFEKTADFMASAADRLPFPHSGKLKVPFDGSEHPFHHPLGGQDGTRLPLKFEGKIHIEEEYDKASKARVILSEGDARSQFISRWRFYRQWLCENEERFAFIPADTRIPDHTIWNHLSITTALQGCIDLDPDDTPALLMFSIGPVQPFIAAARSIRDLWSGSYLISYLVASALSEISHDLGPDHVISPSLWGQPLADLNLADVYKKAFIKDEKSVWENLWRDNPRGRQHYLLPSLPNRFVALVPAKEAKAWGNRLQAAVENKLLAIGESVLRHIEEKSLRSDALQREGTWQPERLLPQLKNSLEIAWCFFPFPKTVKQAEDIALAYLPKQENPANAIQSLRKMWEALPKGHHTSYGLNTNTTAWPAFHALLSWLHDAQKQSRTFDGWQNPAGKEPGRVHNKDSLTGKEEYVLAVPDDEGVAKNLSGDLSGGNPNLFKRNEFIGGLTLVKRLWHLTWLCNSNHCPDTFEIGDFSMPDLHQLAKGKPFDKGTDEAGEEEPRNNITQSDKGSYYAVIALDGDSMGQWISGTNNPKIRKQLAQKSLDYFKDLENEVSNFKSIEEFLEMRRVVSPSFHLQFSETLANFGLHAVRRIVEAFDGRLVYSGGDDVLALLPAQNALECAKKLRAAFRGDADALNQVKGHWKDLGEGEFEKKADTSLFDAKSARKGTIRIHREAPSLAFEPKGYDLLVPGSAADCSTGIAISHIKSPLQDAVREAQTAEKRAKNEGGRAAFAISLIKRSGETIHWHAKWESGAPEIYQELAKALKNGGLSNRFPYRVVELLQPYLLKDNQRAVDGFHTLEVAKVEWRIALDRQCPLKGLTKIQLKESLEKDFFAYLDHINENLKDASPEVRNNTILNGAIGLCNSLAFIERNRSEDKPGKESSFRGPGPRTTTTNL